MSCLARLAADELDRGIDGEARDAAQGEPAEELDSRRGLGRLNDCEHEQDQGAGDAEDASDGDVHRGAFRRRGGGAKSSSSPTRIPVS